MNRSWVGKMRKTVGCGHAATAPNLLITPRPVKKCHKRAGNRERLLMKLGGKDKVIFTVMGLGLYIQVVKRQKKA